MTTRQEFTAKTKLAAWNRCGGFCEKCSMPIKGRPEYDHITPCGLGGTNELDNCQVVCVPCHSQKTHGKEGDRAKINKAERLRRKHLGIDRPNSALSKRNRWTPTPQEQE